MNGRMTAEDLWSAWKRGITPFGERYYGAEQWKETFEDQEWTEGVIEPFVLTSLAPELKTRVRFHQKDEKDAIMFDDTYSSQLVHFEFENHKDKVSGEITKLKRSEPKIKVVVTYPEARTRKEGEKEIQAYVSDVIGPIAESSVSQEHAQVWLLVFGLGYATAQDDWMAYKVWYDGTKVVTARL